MWGYKGDFRREKKIAHFVVIGIIGIGEGSFLSGQGEYSANSEDYCRYWEAGSDEPGCAR